MKVLAGITWVKSQVKLELNDPPRPEFVRISQRRVGESRITLILRTDQDVALLAKSKKKILIKHHLQKLSQFLVACHLLLRPVKVFSTDKEAIDLLECVFDTDIDTDIDFDIGICRGLHCPTWLLPRVPGITTMRQER